MRALGILATRHLWLASFFALVFAVLPLLGWLAIVMMALVTLHNGAQRGFLVLMWACLPLLAMIIAGWHGLTVQASYFFVTAIVVWAMAAGLRRTRSWPLVLQLMAAVGIAAVLVLYLLLPQVLQQLQNYVVQTLQHMDLKLEGVDQQQLIALWSQAVTRFLVASVLGFSCLWLVLARWWQVTLFSPGQLRAELQTIRLNRYAALVVMLLLVAVGFTSLPWLRAVTAVAVLPYSIAGLSVVHNFVTTKKLHTAWLVGFYVILVLAMGFVSVGLAVLAIIDSWCDLRQRWQGYQVRG